VGVAALVLPPVEAREWAVTGQNDTPRYIVAVPTTGERPYAIRDTLTEYYPVAGRYFSSETAAQIVADGYNREHARDVREATDREEAEREFLLLRVEERRGDPEFMGRLRRIVDEDQKSVV
jgi:hypothetical protein